MNEQVLNDGLARRFLLGQLPPEEQGRIEELAFLDPDTFAFLRAVEDDLVDEFLYDELSPDEKELFRKSFLTKPGRPQDVRIARALKQYLAEDEPVNEVVVARTIVSQPKPTFFQWFRLGALSAPLLIAAILIITGLGALVAIQISKNKDEQQAHVQPSPVPTPSSSPAASPAPSASPSPQETPNKPSPTPRQTMEPIFAVLVPTASVRSDDQATKLARPDRPLTLELPVISVTPYRSYKASLQTGETTLQTWSNLKTRELSMGKGIQVTIQPSLLSGSQRFRIVLNGTTANGQTQTVHNYHFQLTE